MEECTSAASPPNESAALPPPDALAPEALREELINIVRLTTVRLPPGTDRNKAVVDNILAKLTEYYTAAATPEVTAEAPQTFAAIQELGHAVDRIIGAGAAMSNDAQLNAARQKWAAAAQSLRGAWNRFLTVLT